MGFAEQDRAEPLFDAHVGEGHVEHFGEGGGGDFGAGFVAVAARGAERFKFAAGD